MATALSRGLTCHGVFPVEPQAYGGAYFGQGELLSKVATFDCTGNEESLLNCSHAASNCGHQKDASIICANVICSNGDVRLSHGSEEYEGTVEVCLASKLGHNL